MDTLTALGATADLVRARSGPQEQGLAVVTCPACPDLDLTADSPAAAVDLAGTHDDTHHHGQPTAHVHDAEDPPGGAA